MNDPSCDLQKQQKIYFFSETSSCSAAQSVWYSTGDGSYLSQVNRSEREADRSPVPSIEVTCQCIHIAIQLTAVATGPLHTDIDQLSVIPSLSSGATVATGNLPPSVRRDALDECRPHTGTPKL